MSNLPIKCPSCEGSLEVKELRCSNCSTEVRGQYSLPALAKMSAEDQQFIVDFVMASGSLKTMGKQMSLSYPTMRNKLDEVIGKLNSNENG